MTHRPEIVRSRKLPISTGLCDSSEFSTTKVNPCLALEYDQSGPPPRLKYDQSEPPYK